MAKRFGNGKVGVMKLNIFADKSNFNRFVSAVDFSDNFFPFSELCGRSVNSELTAYNI